MRIVFVMMVVCTVILFSCTGCSSFAPVQAEFEKDRIEVNSGGVMAERKIKPDGTVIQKIDTRDRSWWDKMQTMGEKFLDVLSGMVNRTSVNANE